MLAPDCFISKTTNMRKLFISLSFYSLLSLFHAGAQVNKGTIFLGGDFGFQHGESKTYLSGPSYSGNAIQVYPVFGFANRNNSVIGLQLSYSRSKIIQDLTQQVQLQNSYGLGFFLRKYKRIKESDFAFFLQFTLSALQSFTYGGSNRADEIVVDNFNASLSFYPGLSYRVNRVLHIEAGFNSLLAINFNHIEEEINIPNPVNRTSSGFGISTSLNNLADLHVGFRFLLEKRKKEQNPSNPN